MDPTLRKMHPPPPGTYNDDMSFVDFDSRMIRAITQQQWATSYHPPPPPPPPMSGPHAMFHGKEMHMAPPPPSSEHQTMVLDLGQQNMTNYTKLHPLPQHTVYNPVPLQGEPSGYKPPPAPPPLPTLPPPPQQHQNQQHQQPPPPPTSGTAQAHAARREAGQKRKRNPEQWKKNVKKRMRQTGQAYTTDTGREVPARRIREGCATACRLHCQENFDAAHREDLFQTFWGLEDKWQQRQYIARHVIKCDVARKRVNTSERRSFTLKYYFFNDKDLTQVCRKFFVDTLDVGRDFIYGTLEKEDPKTGLIAPERQGKHGKQRRVPEAVLNSVREHISSFPVSDANGGKSKSKKRYLEAGLSVAKMYRMYKEYCSARNIQDVASADRYRRVFDEDFNLAFLKPKKT